MKTDRRECLPDGVSMDDYVQDLLRRMPTGTLTHRETWALLEYIRHLQKEVESKDSMVSRMDGL